MQLQIKNQELFVIGFLGASGGVKMHQNRRDIRVEEGVLLVGR
jgi:hypothetical protein